MRGWDALTQSLCPGCYCCEAASTSLGNACALQFRAEAVVPARVAEMTRCIKERDFEGFGQLTMKDSNQFHAICLDTFPPISYLNDISRRIIHLVNCFNTHHGQTKARWKPAEWALGHELQ